MADIGLKYMAAAKMATEPENAAPTYEPGFAVGKMVQINLAVSNSEGKLYADNELAEYVSEFASADLTAEVDNIPLDKQAVMYGATYEDGELMHGSDDIPPQMGAGGVQELRVGGQRKYRTWFFAKIQSVLPDWKGNTKGDSISFGTQPIKAKVTAPKHGAWYRVKEFSGYDAAKAHIDTLLGVRVWHRISAIASGSGAVSGGGAAADGASYVLGITGTPVKVYDNGEDVTASVADGKYTLVNVTEAHNIAVIF